MSDMKGRTVVVTGATRGIGKESARQLLRMGADVVLVGRDAAKLASTEEELARERPGGAISRVRCDFASLASVRSAGSELLARHPQIHVLLNNAGALNTDRKTTEDGHELTFQSNHLGCFLLTHLLRPALEKSGTPARTARIVNVASAIHTRGAIDWADLGCANKPYAGMSVYATSKLMNVMFTYELSRRLAGTHVTANCLHPGVIGSGFGDHNTGWFGFGVKLVTPFLKTPVTGARTNVFLSSSAEVEGVTGRYYDDAARERRTSRASYDEDAQKKLWRVTEEILGLA
jgi:NAD(P)-dependent dehydrogenase (short-subunit alcohol dehydrogenase family)